MENACATTHGQGNLAYHLSRMENDVYNAALSRVLPVVRDAVHRKASARKEAANLAAEEKGVATTPESRRVRRRRQ